MAVTKMLETETGKSQDIEQVATRVKEATVANIAASTEVVASANAAYRDMSKKTYEMTGKMIAFNLGTISAYAEAGRIMGSESQAMFRRLITSSQSSSAETLSGLKTLMSAKTFKESLEVRAALSTTAAIWAISEATNFARSGVEMAEKVSAPILARAYAAAEKMDAVSA